jgi:hypothetical protein
MLLFDRQFKILLEDIKILVTIVDNQEALEKVDFSLKQYSLKNLMPTDYIVSTFNTYITVPFGDKIMNKDETFFVNLQGDDLVSDEFEQQNNDSITFLNSDFRDIWSGLDDKTKEKIWKRMQILVKLCHKWQKERK